MANNYLQFSEAIVQLTDSERDWLQRQLETVYVFGDKEYAEDEVPDELSTAATAWFGCRAFRDFPDIDSGEDIGFEFEFLDNEQLGHYLWMYAEEVGDPDRVAHLVQKFLRQFRPQDSWSLTYATSCSKMRLGEFGGGACFVTAERIEALDSNDFVADRQSHHRLHSLPTQ